MLYLAATPILADFQIATGPDWLRYSVAGLSIAIAAMILIGVRLTPKG